MQTRTQETDADHFSPPARPAAGAIVAAWVATAAVLITLTEPRTFNRRHQS